LRLSELMNDEDGTATIAPSGDPEIRGLSLDSRRIERGFLFAALPGTRTDGRQFIDEAVAKGAVAILTADPKSYETLTRREPPITIVGDVNPRRRIARIASRFYRPQPETVAAVTGTNGKTSVAVFTRQLWQGLGRPAASLGTIGIVAPGFSRPGSLTTPDPVTLHSELNALAQSGIDHVAIEASSHGLDQFRLDGLRPKAAAFTNLSRDHLDYHRDMADYRAAKTRLFTDLLPKDGAAVLNLDDETARELAPQCARRGQRVIGFGRNERADLRLIAARPNAMGQELSLSLFGQSHDVGLPLIGEFQAMNVLAALGLVLATGAELEAAVALLPALVGAPGRMELVGTHPSGAPILVDYAHTPDALGNALGALRRHVKGRIVAVFGAGGDRDVGKRPQMGAVARRLADIVIVTDDNPRNENAALIRRAILEACPNGIEIGDRAEAVRRGLAMLRGGDALLVAGKGHETGQIVGAKTLPFADNEVVRAALRKLGSAA
jgi:UDP-N-acetylmuramoyl-L-alanyl-D-glutamate--2,6-diaminopimelate ligase